MSRRNCCRRDYRQHLSMTSSFPGFSTQQRPRQVVSVEQLSPLSSSDVAVVWYTACDLRIHDHDALLAAATAGASVPLYVFDDEELAEQSKLDTSFAFHSVCELRRSLRNIGSDLVVRSGDVAAEVLKVVKDAGATHIFHHFSPVHVLRRSHERTTKILQTQLESSVIIKSWSASQLTGLKAHDAATAWNFRDFAERSMKEPARAEYPAPTTMVPLPGTINPGDMPALENVLARAGSPDEAVQHILSKEVLEEAPFGSLMLCREGYGESLALRLLDDYLCKDEVDFARGVFGPEEGLPGPGTDAQAEQGLEATSTRRIVKARGYRGLAPGEILARALGVALALGCVSPRRAFLARQPGYAYLPPSSLEDGSLYQRKPRRARGKCWARELAVCESWHSLLAERDVTLGNAREASVEQRYLRWHGWLVRYIVGGEGRDNPHAPAILLVHGFGASSDQWDAFFREYPASTKKLARHDTDGVPVCTPAAAEEVDPSPSPRVSLDQSGGRGDAHGDVKLGHTLPTKEQTGSMDELAGVKLVAIDLAGFGHSAKPPLSYTQYSWADCARDVMLRAVGAPFFIAGNSIGGYIAMGVAADCKDLCRGVVLINSAGRILTKDEYGDEMSSKFEGLSVEEATRQGRLGVYTAPPNVALTALGTGVFAFLQGRIAATCRNLYPVNPDIVDEGLAENILRDSCDPGAVGVIAAGGKLPFSRSVNEMLHKFGGPVLVTQGIKDPLNDADGRARLFEAIGSQVRVVRLDGGHCPHHEVASEVAKAIRRFVRTEHERKEIISKTVR